MKWWDDSWNPITGCSPISEGCENCYAARQCEKWDLPYDFDEITFHADRMGIPLKWKKSRRIFVCSMGDLFHKEVTDVMIASVFAVMAQAKHHTFLVLTKRAERMRDFFNYAPSSITALPNVWLGVTAENQKRTDERIPILLDTPASHRFISVEPMLEYINIKEYTNRLDWIICGGETGSGSREMDKEWAWKLSNQARFGVTSRIPFFMKQMTNRRKIPEDLMIREIP